MTRCARLMPVAIALMCGGCMAADAGEIENSRFDRFCGDRPCGWEVVGKVERVATWHSDDYAVALLSDDVTLSQLNREASSADVSCLSFALLASFDRGTEVYLELDFLDDGEIDFSQRLPAGQYKPHRFLITAPTWYRSVRFIVRKTGKGKVTLAQLEANNSGECVAEPIDLRNRPLGAACEEDAQCREHICGRGWYDGEVLHEFGSYGKCSACRSDDDCAADSVCTVEAVFTEWRACAPRASRKLGEPCERGTECKDGHCCQAVCSECCEDSEDGCAAGASCKFARVPDVATALQPAQCVPLEGGRAAGDTCAIDADCASGICSGDERVCDISVCPDDLPDAGDCCLAKRVVGGQCE